MKLLTRLKRLFRRSKIKTIPLIFSADRPDGGEQTIKVFKQLDDQRVQVTNLHALMDYGYREIRESDEQITIYRVSDQDRQTLLALASLEPQSSSDGVIQFPPEPTILHYIRSKPNLVESAASRILQVESKPLKPTAQIQYNPTSGLHVKTGYSLDNHALIPASELTITKDGRYALIKDTFVPITQKLSDRANEWLSQVNLHIPVGDVPEFFQRDLVLLKSEFEAVLTDLAGQIQVITEAPERVVRVNKQAGGWLDFSVMYESEGYQLPHQLLKSENHKPYVQLSDTTWMKVPHAAIRKTEKELAELGALSTESGLRLPVHEFASLEEFISAIGGRAELDTAYQEFLAQLTGFSTDNSFRLSPATERQLEHVGLQLRPYQRAGIHWLSWLNENHLHGLLADDMGLGKTLQTICALRIAYERTRSRQPSLIIAPRSVIYHWEREIRREI